MTIDPTPQRAFAARFAIKLLCNLWAGVRAAFLLRVLPQHLRVSPLQVAALVMALLIPPLIEQWAHIGAHGQFNSYGIAGAFVVFPFGFVIAALVATLARQRAALPALLVIFLATELCIDVITVLPQLWPKSAVNIFYNTHYERIIELTCYWLAMTVGVAWARLIATSRVQLRLISFFSALLIVLVWKNIWWDRTLWMATPNQTANDEQLERYRAPLREDVLYKQPQLLAQALEKLQPAANESAAHVYYLGFAPYASQNVFMREINTVSTLFESRFAAPERALTLINNAQTINTVPLATKTALAAALTRFGEVMNSERDILFLYLTTHGSREHRLSVEFGPLQLDQIAPTDLKTMLDTAGIRWRVVVISACYSGGFIDALKSDDTLVITAAASDKTSFGCSDEEDFTYFGRAYFDEALRNGNSFIDAFYTAKESVTAREKAEGFESSEPQIALGINIENTLRGFEQQRAQTPVQQ